MSSSSQMSLVSKPKPPSRARPVALQSVAAVLSASLLGIGLAYCACTLLIPAVAREGNGASLLSTDGRSPDVICSGDTSSTSPRQARADE